MLIPDASTRAAQVIDVDDLAAFVVRCGATEWGGVANAIGDTMSLSEMLALARDEAGHTGPLVGADDDWLQSHEVAHWAGPRSLPLWLPADMPGFATRSNAVYRTTGGRIRDVRETLRRTLVDERIPGLDRDRTTGLSRPDELALIAEFA